MVRKQDAIWTLVGPERQYSITWLSKKTGYGYQHIWNVRDGRSKPTPRFRAACSLALGRLEQELFFESDLAIA